MIIDTYDTYDWLGALDTTINKIIEEQVVQNIYLCKNNEYEMNILIPFKYFTPTFY